MNTVPSDALVGHALARALAFEDSVRASAWLTPCSSTHTAATTATQVATNVRLSCTRPLPPRINRTYLYRAPFLSLQIRSGPGPDLLPSPCPLQGLKSPRKLRLTFPHSQRMCLQSTTETKLGRPRGHARKLGELGPLPCFPCSPLQSWQRP